MSLLLAGCIIYVSIEIKDVQNLVSIGGLIVYVLIAVLMSVNPSNVFILLVKIKNIMSILYFII